MKNFFSENLAEDPAQRLAKTWCPYLFWVLRNLPSLKSWHISRNLRKNVTIWAPRKALAPKIMTKFSEFFSAINNSNIEKLIIKLLYACLYHYQQVYKSSYIDLFFREKNNAINIANAKLKFCKATWRNI